VYLSNVRRCSAKELQVKCSRCSFITNFHFGSQQPHTIHHRRIPAHFLSLAGSRGSGQGPVCPNASPEAADHGLPMRFGQTPHRPWWLWIDFSAVTVSLRRQRKAGGSSFKCDIRAGPLGFSWG
jgi:hypothetical protein